MDKNNRHDSFAIKDLGSQLVKKNNNIALLQSKMSVLQSTLDHREKEYGQRCDDIRLLKIEIRRLRHEKELLSKGVENMIDLRQEIFNLERDLKHERIRSKALEELIRTPQNIHRWRKLEGTDPTTLELLEQVRILQKESLEKSQKIKQLQNVRQEIRDNDQSLTLNEIKGELNKVKKKLVTKDDKIKILTAELKLYESQLNEYRQTKYLRTSSSSQNNQRFGRNQKFSDKRFCESAPPLVRTYAKHADVLKKESPKRFLGGGFNLTPKNDTSEN